MGEAGFSGFDKVDPRDPDGHVCLRFDKEQPHPDKPNWTFGSSVSGLASIGRTLFVACDETRSVERLVRSEKGKFKQHLSIPLSRFFKIDDDGEIDLEGLAISGGYLWVVGSHSLGRKEPKAGSDVSEMVSKVEWDRNRALLARIPLMKEEEPGVYSLAKQSGGRTAAMVRRGGGVNTGLRGILSQEGLLRPFIDLPCKENGLDIEGLAVLDDRVFLGLRGPVIGAFALIVELRLAVTEDDPGVLLPQKIRGKPYRIHAANLGGLGIRELLFRGKQLLALSGTTQKAESIQRVFALTLLANGGVLAKERVELLLTLPTDGWGNHAEGMTLLRRGSRTDLIVAYDSPNGDRLNEDRDELKCDFFKL